MKDISDAALVQRYQAKVKAHQNMAPGGDEDGKKKRVEKACDSCRMKKTKCDGRRPCSKCVQDNKLCTFSEKKKQSEKTYSSSYVELLECRINILQDALVKLVTKIADGHDVSQYVPQGTGNSINQVIDMLMTEDEETEIKLEQDRIHKQSPQNDDRQSPDGQFASSPEFYPLSPEHQRSAQAQFQQHQPSGRASPAPQSPVPYSQIQQPQQQHQQPQRQTQRLQRPQPQQQQQQHQQFQQQQQQQQQQQLQQQQQQRQQQQQAQPAQSQQQSQSQSQSQPQSQSHEAYMDMNQLDDLSQLNLGPYKSAAAMAAAAAASMSNGYSIALPDSPISVASSPGSTSNEVFAADSLFWPPLSSTGTSSPEPTVSPAMLDGKSSSFSDLSMLGSSGSASTAYPPAGHKLVRRDSRGHQSKLHRAGSHLHQSSFENDMNSPYSRSSSKRNSFSGGLRRSSHSKSPVHTYSGPFGVDSTTVTSPPNAGLNMGMMDDESSNVDMRTNDNNVFEDLWLGQ